LGDRGALVTASILRDDDPKRESAMRVEAPPTRNVREDLKRMVIEMRDLLSILVVPVDSYAGSL
jgi:hypothetical protein